jgi:hypothetical protein
MYESAIEKVVGEIQSQIIKQDDENIMYAVKQAAGYSVDKNELIKALKYDREQYEKGYRDGLNADKWIPVSEKLPDFIINNTVSEDVLVFDGVDIRVGEYRKGCYMNGAGYWRVYGYDLEEYVDVIAWMPLPTPYEPRESGV